MTAVSQSRRPAARARVLTTLAAAAALVLAACSRSANVDTPAPKAPPPIAEKRVGLKPGLWDYGEATQNLKVSSTTKAPDKFLGSTNSDLAFSGNYAIQGNYNGFIIWDVTNPTRPSLVTSYYCPASQSDVSVFRHLLFVSGEGFNGRTDCGDQPIRDTVSNIRLRGIRIFDISDIRNPKYVANVQTCRGSHTHTVVEDLKDKENVYIYVSGSAPVRSPNELPGCVRSTQGLDRSMFRIEVIKVPLADPTKSAIVSSPRIFEGLVGIRSHGPAIEELKAVEEAKKRGAFVVSFGGGAEQVLPNQFVAVQLDSIVKKNGRTGAPTAADSAELRAGLPALVARITGGNPNANPNAPRPGPNQCHDITVYPAAGLAGGACEGYGILLDIRDPVNPVRIDAVADSNFAYWHSATFNNDGTQILFSDEWGGGGAPKCRATDPKEWGSNAIFEIDPQTRKMKFKSYYKITGAQTSLENCVAHNGSLIPIPGRDVMVQAWYQGGVSVFDWTDPAKPFEIAYHDRGPADSARFSSAGSWSAYWYNGAIVSSEIARGLDVMELVPSEYVSQNEIDAAKTVKLEYLNTQGQPKFTWPPSFALARSFVDQLERNGCLSSSRISAVRQALSDAERAAAGARRGQLESLAGQIASDAGSSCDKKRIGMLEKAVRDLSNVAM
jgi:hypothetical protein